MGSDANLTVCTDPATLAEAAAHLIVDAATQAIKERGRFMVCLAGGETPRATYARLALPAFSERVRWDRTWVFFGDERAVPPEQSRIELPDGRTRPSCRACPFRRPRFCGCAASRPTPTAPPPRTPSNWPRRFGTRRGELHASTSCPGAGGRRAHRVPVPRLAVLREVFRTVAAVHVTAAQIPQRLTSPRRVPNALASSTAVRGGGAVGVGLLAAHPQNLGRRNGHARQEVSYAIR